ncbi:class I cytochrome c [Natronococcus jeotgali DSM 18795]|uniref:Class I cytochrome c n=1 Tax=Natronococcus jeotgali DSM 18795 TaxID=1227498 RepID=L9XQE3_9EURY|nr:class I cytochrome c [Natronococcus jeotgali DSM 18795]
MFRTVNRKLILLAGVLFLVVLAGCSAPSDPGGDNETDPETEVEGGEPIQAPEQWPDRTVLDGDLREGESKDNMTFRNETAGEEIQFSPKEMNNSTLPENENEREMIMYGRDIMANTTGEIPENVGVEMSCGSCHGGSDLGMSQGLPGQDIDMIPLVGTTADLPEWTSRRDRMRDTRQRLMGCFDRSMNSQASEEGTPEYDSREMQAMEAYMQWLSEGVPVKGQPYWSHLNKAEGDEEVPVEEINPVRGAELYLENCASCHGEDGQGIEGTATTLWGPESFNDGAGMSRLYTSSAFIREAMPYGSPHTVSDWRDVQDIAGFMNGHDRPEFEGKEEDFPTAGPPEEGVYYDRTQEELGYDMNPMRKKLELAGIPTGTEELSEDDIPDDVDRYDQPLRNESVDDADS